MNEIKPTINNPSTIKAYGCVKSESIDFNQLSGNVFIKFFNIPKQAK